MLVWFHPGGYSGGTSNEVESDGARLSRRGNVMVVTVNHRLNVFGHLFLAEIGGEAFADSGNAGILDLVLALRWVRDNIEEFGGDPRNVTIFGQSGGGAKCATLMAMPDAARPLPPRPHHERAAGHGQPRGHRHASRRAAAGRRVAVQGSRPARSNRCRWRSSWRRAARPPIWGR